MYLCSLLTEFRRPLSIFKTSGQLCRGLLAFSPGQELLMLKISLLAVSPNSFRTGRRINMRKVISYIASDFRKDRIWLRRTRPWKREHQIIIAMDDSSSMKDNKSKVSYHVCKNQDLESITENLAFLFIHTAQLIVFKNRKSNQKH